MSAPLRRVALVTGVTRKAGIGAAIASALARDRYDVATAYYRPYDRAMPWGVEEGEPEAIVGELRASGAQAYGFEVDLAEPDGARALFAAVRDRFGRVDCLVNNAAVSAATTVDAMTGVALDRHYAVNVRAVALLCAEFVRALPAGASGRIVNLTSGQGTTPLPNELAYATTKGAVDAFTISLSAAVTSRGITVNAVDPGPTDTGWMDPALRATLLRTAPLGRLGTPGDAARLVAFLASEEAGWVTGQIIRSRGGLG